MSQLSQRISALSPEKQLLLEFLRQKETPALGGAGDDGGADADRAPLEPFSLVSRKDREAMSAGIEDAFPLTMVQQGMLSHMDLDAGHEGIPPAYHNVNSWHVRARFDPVTFQRAVNEVVERHPMLRTCFDLTSYSEPLQLVHGSAELPVKVVDLRQIAPSEQTRLIERFILRENHSLVDLSVPPLIHFYVHRRSDETFQFTLTEPHPISDGWSTASTLAEIFDRYLALKAGRPLAKEPPPPVTFREFVHLERQILESEESRAFWDAKLRDCTVTRLPRWPARYRSDGERQDHKLYYNFSTRLVSGLERLARAAAAPIKSVVFAAQLKVMSLASGESEVLTGLVFNGRPEESGGAEVRGLFLNTLPVRIDVGDGTWIDLVRTAFEAETEILPYRRYPLGALQQGWGRDSLFDAAFGFLNFHALDPMLETGEIELMESGHSDLSITHFPLMTIFELSPRDRREMRIVLEYDVEEFCEQQIRDLYEIYELVLEAMAANPRERHRRRSFLSERQLRQLTEDSGSATEVPRQLGVHHLFERQVRLTPKATALVSGELRLSYDELDRLSNRLARFLRAHGVGPETRVAFCLPRGPELLTAVLAILKAGAAYVPLDPELPARRIHFILDDSGATLVLIRSELRPNIAFPDRVKEVFLDRDREVIAEFSSEGLGSTTVEPDQLAYVLYTSGSTGKPKGVLVPHRGLTNYVLWAADAYEVGRGQGSLLHSSIGFDLTVTALFTPLVIGRTVVVVPDESGPEDLGEILATHEFSLVKLTPAHLELLRQESMERGVRTHTLVIGGEALTGSAISFLAREAPETRIVNEYGPTETVVGCCVHMFAPQAVVEGTVPIGKPVANTRLYVVDAHLQRAPLGAPGELLIGGDGVTRGYHGRPGRTAASFIPDPFSRVADARLYRSGDSVRYLPDGNLEFLGRFDHQVKIHGYRVELGEIEEVAVRHPSVRRAAVVLRADASGQQRLLAYAEIETGAQLDLEQLQVFLADKLPNYMIPDSLTCVDALPLTANGKIDRQALPEPDAGPKRERAYVAPRTPAEEQLAAIWAEILGVEKVGIHDNFFELGGDSIRGLMSVSRAKRAGLSLSSRQVFQHPTIAELAQIVGGLEGRPLAKMPATGRAPLMPIQRWFFEQELSDPHHFNQALMLQILKPLAPERLGKVLGKIVRHHDALRTRFERTAAGWRQIVGEAEAEPCFSVVDLKALPQERRSVAVTRAATGLQRSFDLERGRLLRVAYFDLGGSEPGRLLLIAHHLVVDGVSWRILLEDLQTAYQQLKDGQPIVLQAKTSPFRQWARRLEELASSEKLVRERSFWLAPPPGSWVVLPRDYPEGQNTVASSRLVAKWIGPEETGQLMREAVKAYDAQFHELLLSALVMCLAPWTKGGSLRIDLEGHGREEIFDDLDVSRTVGWFTSLFPLTLHADPAAEPASVVREVRRQLRQIPDRGIGYGVLRYLGDPATAAQLRALPPPEVSFNYLGQLDHVIPEPDAMRLAVESAGPLRAASGLRTHSLEITAQVAEGLLVVECAFSRNVHLSETIEKLLDDYIGALRTLLDQRPAETPRAAPSHRQRVSLEDLSLALEEADFEG